MFELPFFCRFVNARILDTLNATVGVWRREKGYAPKLLSKQKFAENLNRDANLFPGAILPVRVSL